MTSNAGSTYLDPRRGEHIWTNCTLATSSLSTLLGEKLGFYTKVIETHDGIWVRLEDEQQTILYDRWRWWSNPDVYTDTNKDEDGISKSYPLMDIAKKFCISYDDVLHLADASLWRHHSAHQNAALTRLSETLPNQEQIELSMLIAKYLHKQGVRL